MIHHRPQGFDHEFFQRRLSSSAADGGSMFSGVSLPASEAETAGTAPAVSDQGRTEDALGGKRARLQG